MLALGGDLEVPRMLLRVGANVNARTHDGETPLMQAAVGSDPAAVRMLLRAGAEVNARSHRGETALIYATGRIGHHYVAQHYDGKDRRLYHDAVIVRILIAAGADLDVKDEGGETALAKAELSGEKHLIEALRRAGARGLREELTGVPEADFFYAVRTQDMAAVKRHVRRGASVAVQDRRGMTPLMYAAAQHDGVLIRYLLKHARSVKQSLELKDANGETALLQARIYEYSFAKLLEAGANPDVTYGRQHLYHTVPPRQQQLLIKAGLKPPPE